MKSNFIEIPLRHEWSSVNLLHTSGIPFPMNTSGRVASCISILKSVALKKGICNLKERLT